LTSAPKSQARESNLTIDDQQQPSAGSDTPPLKERHMGWLVGTAATVVIGGAAVVGAAVSGHATAGGPCLHGIPAPAMVPNIDGSMSPPGTPGAI
jgi:hypothetical protein